ncbi:MAG: LCP family protein [Gudongella sp.]|nr:LCP family protein [Gudongella sp.]
MKKQFFMIFLSSLLFFGLVYGVLANTLFKDVSSSEPDIGLETENPSVEEPEQEEINSVFFLLMGVDANDVTKSKGTRTDTMMLTEIDFDTGKIKLLSIPRDTRTTVEGRQDKINAAHAYGGSEASVAAVKSLLGVELEYFVKVDYQIVQDVVNAIGGVTIDVPFTMTYSDPTAKPPLKINIPKGDQQTLDGKNAHDFLRWRHNNAMTVGYPDGDVGRTKAQQYFMKEFVKQTIKPKNLLQLPKMVDTYFKNVETNIPLKLMVKGALSANKIDVDSMETATVPGAGQYIGGVSYYIYNGSETDELVKEMFPDYLAK